MGKVKSELYDSEKDINNEYFEQSIQQQIKEKEMDNRMIPSLIRIGNSSIDYDKIINNLKEQIDNYYRKDTVITKLEHEMNVKTLEHFNNIKNWEGNMIEKFNEIWDEIPDIIQAVLVMSAISIFWIFVLG